MTKYLGYLLPFLFFLGGYYTLSRLVVVQSFESPNLVGSTLEEAVVLCGDYKLIPTIMSFYEDSDMVPGTVIQQVPAAGTHVKPGQQMMMSVARLPQKEKAPQLSGRMRNNSAFKEKHNIVIKEYTLVDSAYPLGMVIAQTPEFQVPLSTSELVIYTAMLPEKDLRIVPDFKGLTTQEVQQWCVRAGHECEIVIAEQKSLNENFPLCVKAQMPLAGSFVDVHKKVLFQFMVARDR